MKPKPTIITCLILIAAAFFLGKCTGSEPEKVMPADAQHTIDSITAADRLHKAEILNLQANLVEVNKRKDHHDSIRIVYRTRYQTIREITPADSAQCFELLAQTRLACDSTLSSTDSVISDYEAKDSLQSRIIMVQEKQLDGKDQIIDLYHGQVEKSKADLKREKRKRFWVAAGALIVGGGLGVVLAR